MLPFGVWGLMMIVINGVAHSQLANVGSPVALFNLVSPGTINQSLKACVRPALQSALLPLTIQPSVHNTRYATAPKLLQLLLLLLDWG